METGTFTGKGLQFGALEYFVNNFDQSDVYFYGVPMVVFCVLHIAFARYVVVVGYLLPTE